MVSFASLQQRVSKLRLVWLLLPLQLAYAVYVICYAQTAGELPPPFFYNPFDSFMDFFNTNYWAVHDGRYQDWQSVYPLFVFALGKLITSSACIASQSGRVLRACNLGAVWFLVAAYGVGIACSARLIVARLPNKQARWREGLAWFVVLGLSSPGLIALERGNYVILAFMFLGLAAVSEGTWKSALFLALAICVKQYLAILWLVPLFKRRYDQLALGVVFVVLIHWLSYSIVPDPNYGQIFPNMAKFASMTSYDVLDKAWLPTSLSTWVSLSDNADVTGSIFGRYILFFHALFTAVFWATCGFFGLAIIIAATRARSIDRHYLSFICIVAVLAYSSNFGAYTMLLLLPFVESLAARPYARLMIALTLLICLPLRYSTGPFLPRAMFSGTSLIGPETFSAPMDFAVGSYGRPLLITALILVILFDLTSKAAPRSATSRTPS